MSKQELEQHGWMAKEHEYRVIPQVPEVIREQDKVPVQRVNGSLRTKQGSTVWIDEQKAWPKCGLKAGVPILLSRVPDIALLDVISNMEANPKKETSELLDEMIAAHKEANKSTQDTPLIIKKEREDAVDAVWVKFQPYL